MDRLGVLGLGGGLGGGQVVGGEHLRHLVLVRQGGPEVLGGGQVSGLALAFGEGLVGDVADEVLEEAVLAVLG